MAEAKIQQTNMVSLKNINQATPTQVQVKLLAWWNQEYQQHNTNLGQIRHQLAAGDMQQAIVELQQQLYSNEPNELNIDWQQLIKQGLFKPAKTVAEKVVGLPELYS